LQNGHSLPKKSSKVGLLALTNVAKLAKRIIEIMLSADLKNCELGVNANCF